MNEMYHNLLKYLLTAAARINLAQHWKRNLAVNIGLETKIEEYVAVEKKKRQK